MDKIYIFVGGHARQNNGHAGVGICYHTDINSPPFFEESEYVGVETQNSAVYRALIKAMTKARDWNIKEVEIYSDNRLVVGQMGASMLARAQNIKPLHDEVRNLTSGFNDYSIKFIPGRDNRRSKELARSAAAASPEMSAAQAIRFDVAPGITGLVLAFTPKLMVVQFKYKKGSKIAVHKHGHEQASYIVSGSLKYVVAEKDIVMGRGSALVVSGNAEHQIDALADTTEIVTYYPMRADLLKLN